MNTAFLPDEATRTHPRGDRPPSHLLFVYSSIPQKARKIIEPRYGIGTDGRRKRSAGRLAPFTTRDRFPG